MSSIAPLQVYSMPGVGRLSTLSPFSLKLETWLRMAGVPYAHQDAFFHQSPNGYLPFAEHEGERLTDSSRIIAYAAGKFGADLDAGLTPAARAIATLLTVAFEESLYFVRVHDSFVSDDNFAKVKTFVCQFLPPEQHAVVPDVMRQAQLAKLAKQGFGALTSAEVHTRGTSIIDAAAQLLGDKPFFLGDAPRTVDAVIYGFLATQVGGLIDSAISARVRSHANLVAFIARVDARYWA